MLVMPVTSHAFCRHMTPARIHQIHQDSRVRLPMLAVNEDLHIVCSELSGLCKGQRVMPAP